MFLIHWLGTLLYSIKVLIIISFNFSRRITITGNLRLLTWHLFLILSSVSLWSANTFSYYCGYCFNVYISIWSLVFIDYWRQSGDPFWLVQLYFWTKYILSSRYEKKKTHFCLSDNVRVEKVWHTTFLNYVGRSSVLITRVYKNNPNYWNTYILSLYSLIRKKEHREEGQKDREKKKLTPLLFVTSTCVVAVGCCIGKNF